MGEGIMKVGDKKYGFTCEQVEELPDLRATLIRLEHEETGAEHIHFASEDENNLFSVAFRTTPTDSTGVAHILEHTVLCGSKKFPVRDPFFSMLKRSLNTFMNALTANDWTMYPFSTMNEKDFYNLMDVYLDASFFPNIRELSFKQEGWRLEFEEPENPESELLYKGVVYNEMKGAMSDPSSLMHRRMQKALYPTTTYHHNSGGEPCDIPDLTWEQLKQFHASHYHPSNAKFFTYGNMPLEKHLKVIDERVLSRFNKIEVNTAVGEEKRFDAPKIESFTYSVEQDTTDEDMKKKSFVSLAWLTCPVTDPFEVFSLDILSQLLLGSAAAPLYKALMDSKLGSQLAPGTGYDSENRDTCFAAGLQGADAANAEKIELLILDTLQGLAEKGFPEDRIEAVIHQQEFSNKEVVGSYYPYGLNLLFRMFACWVHDGDPVSALQLNEHIDRLRLEMRSGDFFQKKIRKYLLDNGHRVRVELRPDKGLSAKEASDEVARLSSIREKLAEAEIDQIISDSKALKEEQEGKEDIDCLPTLAIKDIPLKIPETAYEKKVLKGIDSYWFDQPTNGISYFNAIVPVGSVPEDLKQYVPLFCSVLMRMGAAGMDYTKMSERIEAYTGGVGAGANIWEALDSLDKSREVVEFSAKALVRNQEKLFEILADFFTSPDFRDYKRLHTLIGQMKTSMENSVPGSGHSYARGLAASSLTPAARQRQEWFGIRYLHLIKELAKLEEGQLGEVAEKLEAIAVHLLNRSAMKVSVVTEARYFESMEGLVTSFIENIRDNKNIPSTKVAFKQSSVMEGWSANVPVSYVVRVFKATPYTDDDSAALLVLSKLLRACYLHREIREKGGAYGGLASYSATEGLFSFLSYRDPHLERTLQVYEDAIDWVIKGEFSDEDLKEAILSTFSDVDKPLSPAGKGNREFSATLRCLTPLMRQKRRKLLLALDRQALVDVAKLYLKDGLDASSVAVVSAEERLNEANENLGDAALSIQKI
ncbi:MAG: insulinase family protein [Proteobacteria bacterium]|nr:insulinase family protein [Pseudomonadota bacterium]